MLRGLFIGGCDRSGTTMLGSMLGAAERVIVTPESQFMWRLFPNIDINADITTQDIINVISNHWRFKIWDIDINELVLNDPPEQSGKYPYCIAKLVNAYASKKGIINPEVWIDHTPTNIDNIEFLSSLLGNAKFIHLIRDGRGIASSFKNLDWGPNTVKDSAFWWKMKIASGLAAEKRYLRDKLIAVRYEDILENPEKELRRICSFSGIDYKESMLLGGSFDIPKYTKVQHRLVGKRLDKFKAESWRKHLTSREIELFEYEASELLSYLGYEPLYGIKARGPTTYESMKYHLSGFKNVINYVRQKYRRLTTILA